MKPGMVMASSVAVADKYVIDGAVEGVAGGTTLIGQLVSRFQNGYIRSYAAYMTLGVVGALLIALASRF